MRSFLPDYLPISPISILQEQGNLPGTTSRGLDEGVNALPKYLTRLDAGLN